MMGFHEAVNAFKAALIRHEVAGANGNVSQAARALGLDRNYLCRLIRQFAPDIARPPMTRGMTLKEWQTLAVTMKSEQDVRVDPSRSCCATTLERVVLQGRVVEVCVEGHEREVAA